MSTQRTKFLSPLLPKEHNYKKVIGFDIETKGEENDFVLACFYSDDLQYTCYSKQEVVDFISSRRLRNYNVFATNLGFDFLGTLYENSNQWSVLERNGCIYSFKWYQNISEDGKLTKPVNFFDTMRILPFSVEKLGKLVNIPKMDHPSCFSKQPQNEKEYKELQEYCMNDARVSFEFIKQIVIPFLEKYNLKFKCTIGSLALDDFRTNHLNIPLFQESERNREIAFKSYYGGRTETFQRGLFENVYCFDVNSLYPSAMLNKIPNPNKSFYSDKGDLYNINTKEGVSDVLVSVPLSLKIPPLPFHKDGKLIFPVGTFRGYYNHNELRNAMKYGVKILEVFEQLTYKESEYFFKSFIEHHYAERLKLQALKDPLEVMEKNVMNNLYGKFAFNYKKSSSLIPEHDFDFKKHVETATFIEPLCNNKFISVESTNAEAPIYSFPIISSYITSYARIKMYDYLSDDRIYDKLISTDTDSIFLHSYAGEIETSNKLGDMKLEDGYPIKDAIFIRPKFYKTFKPKCKGIKFSDNAEKEFQTILNHEPIYQERFIKFRTAIRSQTHHINGVLKPNQIIKIEKKLDLEDTKRYWIEPFRATRPQQSMPIIIDHDEELNIIRQKELENQAKLNLLTNTYIKDNIDYLGDSDLLDSKGDDISNEEFIQNEIYFDLNT